MRRRYYGRIAHELDRARARAHLHRIEQVNVAGTWLGVIVVLVSSLMGQTRYWAKRVGFHSLAGRALCLDGNSNLSRVGSLLVVTLRVRDDIVDQLSRELRRQARWMFKGAKAAS